MEVSLQNLAKRYNKEWIFKDLSYDLAAGECYALIGSNGSGKSTLLQIISGYHLPSAGSIAYMNQGAPIAPEHIFQHISISTPYMELIDEFTLREHLDFHFKFRKMREGYTVHKIIESCLLLSARDKYIKNFSSGMKQRLKLALSFYTESKLVLLDEPTSNLDNQGTQWYMERVRELRKTDATVLIASNQDYEYEEFCSEHIDLLKYKN
ncbi:ABC transporter ATP-binding protein [Fulvivirga sp. 29W222]|uniref:ABC transporter ATP-binding protein n=1 Tax=Fulvivirga marina TaxID=2494733 RepID=A0A937FTY8_9BACT|nr:ABC transporter ATP-binding protein [Fulvivirga marina]MBL6445975.1 ABC transporter ATP-binding protein [Fulvivirga marina]